MAAMVDDDDDLLESVAERMTVSESKVVDGDDDGLVGARCVEIVPDGSERHDVGGVVYEARLPPIATATAATHSPGWTATCAPTSDDLDTNVVVSESFVLPAGGPVEIHYALKVDMEIIDEPAPPPGTRLRRDDAGGWSRSASSPG